MTGEQRLAVLAALALLVTMFLPWYSLQALIRAPGRSPRHSISAFGVFSFVEAAVLPRRGRRHLHDVRPQPKAARSTCRAATATVVMIAGGWVAFLIFYRVFDRPNGHGYPVGIQWGFFLAFVAAGALCYAGLRIRRAHAPEPPLPGEPTGGRRRRPGRTRRPPRPASPAPASAGRTTPGSKGS